MMTIANWVCILSTALTLHHAVESAPVISGELRIWHKVTLTFVGPRRTEESSTFRDYRLDVTFSKGGLSFKVPGYFAADGNSAETSADVGSMWRVHFAPGLVGEWQWMASFVQGPNAAFDDQTPTTIVPAVNGDRIHGSSGSFRVTTSNKSGIDNRSPQKGRLRYVGKHHLKWIGSGNYFLKFGADAPENFLAYAGFDNTPDIRAKGIRKNYTAHIADYNNDGQLWQKKGHGIFGAINYLASKGVNVHSFLTGNIQGDDRNVFMYVSNRTSDRDVFDVSKCDQWERVFEHMDKKGMYLHFKTQETENDGGKTRRGDQKPVVLEPDARKLYYRELVARFSHHLALNWNIGEENTNSPQEREDFSNWISDLDPYNHNVVLHTFPSLNEKRLIYGDLIRNQASNSYTGCSLQIDYTEVHDHTLELVRNTSASRRPWVVAVDETGPANVGIYSDTDDRDPNHDIQRKDVIYGNIMAGGAGVETYSGSSPVYGDQRLEDYRYYDEWWSQGKLALDFFVRNSISFQNMFSDDDIVGSNAWVLRDTQTVVVYVFSRAPVKINLSSMTGTHFSVSWYSPTTGGDLVAGSTACISKGMQVSLGSPPTQGGPDRIALLREADCVDSRPIPSPTANPSPISDLCFAPSERSMSSGNALERSSVFIGAEDVIDRDGWVVGRSGLITYVTWKGGVQSLRGAMSNPRGSLKYNFVLPSTGNYFINFRGSRGTYTAVRKNRSVWLKMDDSPFEKAFLLLDDISNGSAWRLNPQFKRNGEFNDPQYRLTSGKHTLQILAREPGVWIDEIFVLPFELSLASLRPSFFPRLAKGPSNLVPC